MTTLRSVIALAAVLLASAPATAQSPAAPVPAPKGMQVRDVIAKLSPAGQESFRSDWLAFEHQASMQRKAAAHAAEDGVFQAMAAEPFNATALRHAYEVQRNVYANNQRARQEHLVSVLAKLSPSDRATVVAMLRAMREQNTPHAP